MFFQNSIAQTISNALPKVTLPSPTAFSMIKYTDAPINTSGGRPDVTIPIYTINEPGITLPVTFNYGSGGVKVDELASSYGLGWNLIAGGVITREVRGIMDEASVRKKPEDFDDMSMLTGYATVDIGYQRHLAGITDLSYGCEYFDTHSYNNYQYNDQDLEADVFYFNFNGYSGKFMFENGIDNVTGDVAPVFFPMRKDLKIRKVMGIYSPFTTPQGQLYNMNIIQEWEITTPDGMKYYFGQNSTKEITHNRSTNNEEIYNREQITAWYLTRIYNPVSKEEITFTYYQHNYTYQSVNDEFYSYARSPLYDICNYMAQLNYNTFSRRYSSIKSFVIDEINSSKVRVKFKGVANRQDVDQYNINLQESINTNAKIIDEIEIYDKWHNQVLKKYLLNYNYFVSATTKSSYLQISDTNSDIKRLRLNSITEIGSDDTALPSYTFSYYDQSDVGWLPRRMSFAKDSWGYFNSINNARLLPLCSQPADRSSNSTVAKAFMLKQVKYPTGGIHSFEYGYLAGLRLDKIKMKDPTEIGLIEQHYSYDLGTLLNVVHSYDFQNTANIADVTVLGMEPGDSGPGCYSLATGPHPYNNAFHLQGNPNYISLGTQDFRILSVRSSAPILSVNVPNFASPIYGSVTVKNMDNGVFKGSKNYTFHRPSYLSWIDKYPAIREENGLYGKPIYEEIRNSEGTLLHRVDYSYEDYADPRQIKGTLTASSRSFYNGNATWESRMHFYRFYSLVSKSYRLQTKKITEYENGQEIENLYTYGYSNTIGRKIDLPSSVQHIDSQGNVVLESTYYSGDNSWPADYGSTTNLQALYNANRLNEVVYTSKYRNGTIVDKSKKNYSLQSNIQQPLEVFFAKFNNPFESRVKYLFNDSNGNPLEFRKTDDISTVVIWGYQKKYPIAEIKAVTMSYAFINSYVVNLQNLSNLDVDAVSEENLRVALNNLRTQFPNDMITTYTYDPNIGITSKTDEKGYTLYYTYDNFQRLTCIKERGAVAGTFNILSCNEYKYKL
ncbi:hypothetical protein [Flavobacterium soli]|uniref:hypothetical protein n=1 Tax=Flavobacterium soli TaxID=344881 RepID=UPI00047E08D5|nr:hypothetical protein [Flavobacterium soli]